MFFMLKFLEYVKNFIYELLIIAFFPSPQNDDDENHTQNENSSKSDKLELEDTDSGYDELLKYYHFSRILRYKSFKNRLSFKESLKQYGKGVGFIIDLAQSCCCKSNEYFKEFESDCNEKIEIIEILQKGFMEKYYYCIIPLIYFARSNEKLQRKCINVEFLMYLKKWVLDCCQKKLNLVVDDDELNCYYIYCLKFIESICVCVKCNISNNDQYIIECKHKEHVRLYFAKWGDYDTLDMIKFIYDLLKMEENENCFLLLTKIFGRFSYYYMYFCTFPDYKRIKPEEEVKRFLQLFDYLGDLMEKFYDKILYFHELSNNKFHEERMDIIIRALFCYLFLPNFLIEMKEHEEMGRVLEETKVILIDRIYKSGILNIVRSNFKFYPSITSLIFKIVYNSKSKYRRIRILGRILSLYNSDYVINDIIYQCNSNISHIRKSSLYVLNCLVSCFLNKVRVTRNINKPIKKLFMKKMFIRFEILNNMKWEESQKYAQKFELQCEVLTKKQYNSYIPSTFCSTCKKEIGKDALLLCSICCNVCYCSRQCQVREWNFHKFECSRFEDIYFKVGVCNMYFVKSSSIIRQSIKRNRISLDNCIVIIDGNSPAMSFTSHHLDTFLTKKYLLYHKNGIDTQQAVVKIKRKIDLFKNDVKKMKYQNNVHVQLKNTKQVFILCLIRKGVFHMISKHIILKKFEMVQEFYDIKVICKKW